MSRPNYGIDAPNVIRNLILLGLAFAVVSLIWHRVTIANVTFILFPGLLFAAGWCIAPALLMVLYAKVGKFRHRDRILGYANLRGDAQVLDIGTGRGLLLAGAAKRLTTGRAIGIDIWNQEDLSGNNLQATQRNLELEGVAAKTEVQNQNARAMSFPDATFDVIVSNLCLHNIYEAQGRDEACREIARVLKPTGTAVISDFRHTREYAANFQRAGLSVEPKPLRWDTFPPLRILVIRKP